MSSALRLARTAFPEREDKDVSAPDQWALGALSMLRGLVRPAAQREVARISRAMREAAGELGSADDPALVERLGRLAPAAVHGRDRAAVTQALLTVAEAARRCLAMEPYAVQLFAASVLLSGRLAEMQTGEGKTLTAGLAACLAGAAGVPVHVVTVNDYLAGRDAQWLRPLFDFFGLSVGVVKHGVDPDARRRAYACDITYCTNKELVFDYLRDRVAAGGRASVAQLRARRLFGDAAGAPLLRGLHFAIVDECDSILIDEARTPLILAEKAGAVDHAPAFAQAVAIAGALEAEHHWTLDAARREIRLSDAGRLALRQATATLGGPWNAEHVREHMGLQALRALHLYLRDHHYLVDGEGKVHIVDEYTGRVLPGRTWEAGLHQMIEAKEGVPLSEQTHTLARITYQRFFCRYLRLAGMTGTASEVSRELAAVYRLETVRVPTHRPCIRVRLPNRLCTDEPAKWEAVAAFVADRHGVGQPVLVGTRSVEASDRLSAALHARRLPHHVLNARQDEDEAMIIAKAGQRGAITVATNMAGRGTDIALGDGVRALGGLCVILTEFHESPRIDRQLFGRSARQGDPGTAVAIVALDDGLFREHGGAEHALLRRTSSASALRVALVHARASAQRRAERMHARTRRDTLRHDRAIDKLMSISGDPL